MKNILTIFGLTLASISCAFAQDDVQRATAEAAAALAGAPREEAAAEKPSYWKSSMEFSLGFNNTSLWNWAAGGYNTLTLNTGVDGRANYAKDLLSWNNRLQLQYGFLWAADKKDLIQKSTDRLYFESRAAYRTAKNSKWNYTASFDFRSQFTDSFDSYKQDEDGNWSGQLKSGFLSPAYSTLAVGMEWAPKPWFTLNIAPVTGSVTLCGIPSLRKNYGMHLKHNGDDPGIGENYGSALFQLGPQIKMDLKAQVNDVFKYETQLVMFTNYFDSPFRSNRVNWDNKITWAASKYLRVGVDTWLIYDPLVTIDGRQRVQFKEFFSVNFTYTIDGKGLRFWKK